MDRHVHIPSIDVYCIFGLRPLSSLRSSVSIISSSDFNPTQNPTHMHRIHPTHTSYHTNIVLEREQFPTETNRCSHRFHRPFRLQPLSCRCFARTCIYIYIYIYTHTHMMNLYSSPPLYLSSGPFSKSHSGCTARSSRFSAEQSTVYQTAKPACHLAV